jgi:hypothetical protein
MTESGLLLKLKSSPTVTPLTDQLSAMNLPVADWEQMEQEVEAGRLSS